MKKSEINFEMLGDGLTFSKYQKDFFTAIKNTNNHISIEATAGSGKTTTILTALKLIPRFRKSIFLSFSNNIVNTLKDRIPIGVQASTLHSLGMRFLTQYYPGIRVNPNKYLQLALNYFGQKNKETFKKAYMIQDISSYVRMTLTPLEIDEIEKMCDKYDVNCTSEAIETTIELIQQDEYPASIDFADMVFMPAVYEDMVQENFDYVFLDEAQDCSKAQIQMVQNILKPNSGRLISVGDSDQSIYSFSGGDIDAFKTLKNIKGTIELPLSISYRCGKRIVEQARRISSKIEANKNAHEGVVRSGFFAEIQEGDMVLCRNNAPLVDMYFRLIDEDKKAKIYGKDIEKGIIQIAERCMAKHIDKFVENLYAELDKVLDELVKKGVRQPDKHIKFGNMADKVELLEIIANKVNSTAEIIPLIKNMFVDNEAEGVKLLTIHKAKGMENNRVFILEHYKGKRLIPSQFATQKWQLEQERNLEFVAITRAINELIYIDL